MQTSRLHLTALGRWYPVLTFFGRLPFSMQVVGALTMVVAVRGEVQLGALAAACLGLSCSVCAPVLGFLADRCGQRPVLLAVAALHALAVTAFIVVTVFGTSVFGAVAWPVAVTAALVGATLSPVSPFARGRDTAFVAAQVPPAHQEVARTRLFAQESTLDEISFVAGPVLVGLLAALWHPVATLVLAVMLTGFGAVALVWHPSARFAGPAQLRGAPRAAVLARGGSTAAASALPSATSHGAHTASAHDRTAAALQASSAANQLRMWRVLTLPRVLRLTFLHLLLGAVFGTTLTALTIFLETFHAAKTAGIWYGLMGFSSACLALLTPWFAARLTAAQRLLGFAVVTVAGTALFGALATGSELLPGGGAGAAPDVIAAAANEFTVLTGVVLAAALLLIGVGIGPLLVTGFALGAQRAPAGGATTVLTQLTASITAGQALAAGVTGAAQQHFAMSALWLPCLAALVLVVAALLAGRDELPVS